MPKEIKDLTKVTCLTTLNNLCSISIQIQMLSINNVNGDHDTEHLPKEATIIHLSPANTITKPLLPTVDSCRQSIKFFPIMTTLSTSSMVDEAPPYHKSLNVNEQYVQWGEQQPHENDIIPIPAYSTASSYWSYVQLALPNGTMFVFETFTARPEDWTALFSLVDSQHTIIISFDEADDCTGIYVLHSIQFCTSRHKKNKYTIMKAIHFDAYRVIQNMAISSPLYELARSISFIPEKCTLKARVSAMWALEVCWLTLKFLAVVCFFKDPKNSYLQSDVLTYPAINGFYPILLFLALGRYGFIP
uniref:Uncharacterized protein n=1 Tax=Romanomermis culicivorax TaxID=13658 RepID=A0A915JKM1_ROMCU